MIYIHFAEGTEEIEFVTIIDLLRSGWPALTASS